jgi:hypothetical protein
MASGHLQLKGQRMSQISIGSAVGSGFQLIGRKPLTVLAWGFVRIAFGVGIFAIYAPLLIGMIGPIMQNAQAQAAGGPDSSNALAQSLMPQMMTLQGVSYLIQIAGLLLSAILFCAVTRAIVHPQRGAFAYLRITAVEFYLMAISFGASFAVALALMVVSIPFVIVVVILAVQKMVTAAIIVGVLAAIVLIVASIYILLRFAFVVPMMVDDGKFHLFDAWSLTKGKAGSLFVIGLCLMLIAFAAEAVIGALAIGLGVAALGVSAGGLENLQAFFQLPPMTILTRLMPWLIVFGVAAIPIEGCAMAIFMAPWARAYRDVVPLAASISAVPPPSAPLPPADPPAAPTAPEPPIQPTPTAA